ncbi:hypothetical protein [Actinomadura alba]|uniref:Uncharacterized protein n=1 Tax=Actinomadura alba TaxID=406431 RepID=A0ABR7LTG5_9ACTN|nr:hypothetical protein [Actinomadura alba]MBC6468143.1 hypothetical protein [Actinomadura alba]
MRHLTSKSTRLGALLLMAVAGATASAGGASADGAPEAGAAPASGWRHHDVPVQGSANLTAVVATGRSDAWVGGFHVKINGASMSPDAPGARAADDLCDTITADFPSLMLRWNGIAWNQVAVPNVGRINDLSAAGANDMWALGDCGLLRWDGRSWKNTAHAEVPGEQASVNDLHTTGPEEAWLVGNTYDVLTEVEKGFVQRWNGRNWRLLTLPAIEDSHHLSSVAARGANDVWVVGTVYGDDARPDRLLLLHWDGTLWERVPEPETGQWTLRPEEVRITARDDAWVVGWSKTAPDREQIRRPMILHWNGLRWTTSPVPDGPGELYDMSKSGGRGWAVGDTFSPTAPTYEMYVLRWAGDRWVNHPVPHEGEGMINGVAAVPGGDTWVVGSTAGPYPMIARHAEDVG